MYTTVRVEVIKDELNKEIFSFVLLSNQLVLDGYSLAQRKTKRHGYVNNEWYNRLNERSSTIKEASVPINDTIKQEAKELLFEKILVVMPSEFKR